MQVKKLIWLMVLLLALLSSTGLAYAQELGVGINTGKITVDEPMMPGGSYKLPSVGIINTGQVMTDYEMAISYHEGQPELKPAAAWFNFDPKTITLEPKQSKNIAITLHIPANARPGAYFVYLEAHPVAKAGAVAIGIAAVARLYFTVKPANIFSALANQASAFIQDQAPYSWVVLGVILLVIIIILIRRFVRISLRVE